MLVELAASLGTFFLGVGVGHLVIREMIKDTTEVKMIKDTTEVMHDVGELLETLIDSIEEDIKEEKP